MLGVIPPAAGSGLGKALLNVGLQHLEQRGNTTVELYVEADNRMRSACTGPMASALPTVM